VCHHLPIHRPMRPRLTAMFCHLVRSFGTECRAVAFDRVHMRPRLAFDLPGTSTRLVRVVCAASVAYAAATADAQASGTSGTLESALCRVSFHHVDSIHLGTDRPVYVEPHDLSAVGGRLLLLGIPTYVGDPRRSGATPHVARDSVVGALRSASGRWQLIPSPLPGRHPFEFRASARSDGSWDVVFLELDSPYRPQSSDSATALWYAKLRDTTWSNLERVPLPARPAVHLLRGSRLVRNGETLVWATGLERDSTGNPLPGLVISRESGMWRWRVLGYPVTWLQLIESRDGTPHLLEHSAVGWPGAHTESVTRSALTRSPVALARLPLRDALWFDAVSRRGGAALVTYQTQRRGDGMRWQSVILDAHGDTRRLNVTDLPSRVRGLAAPNDSMPALWVADVRSRGDTAPSIVLRRGAGPGAIAFATLPNPFVGPSPVVQESDTTWSVVGPAFAHRAGGTWYQSVLLTFGVRCRVRS
jgi:hypothetical protein